LQRADSRQIILLKRATAADAQALYLLRYEAYLPQYGAYGSPDCPCVQQMEDFVAQIEQGNTYIVTLGDRPVGGLTMDVQADAVEVRELYILPDFQQMGVGQVALMHAEQRYPSARYRARVISGEVAAMALLKKMGYRAQPTYDKPTDRITLLCMEKDASSMVTLALEPLRREELSTVIGWCGEDPDAPLYCTLWLHGRGKALTMAEFSKEFAFGKHYIGAPQMDFAVKAVEFGRMIGVVSLTKLDWEMHRGTLDFLVLDPKWRGGRLGQRVVAQLCQLAEGQYGFRSLGLTVMEGNARAIGCFIKCGFTETLRRQNVMRGGDDMPHTRILMMRTAKEK
jgi:ribosomal protein S18 acetylase RimI-like enzyme